MRTFVKKMAVLLITAMPCLMFAQTIRYDYDGAGNRLTRYIVMSPNRVAKSTSIDEFLSDSLSKRNIRIYPNPTQGLLRIRIEQLSEDDICSIHYSLYQASRFCLCHYRPQKLSSTLATNQMVFISSRFY